MPHLPPGVNNLLQSDPTVGEYDAGRLYLAKWALNVAEQAEDAARLEHPDQLLSNNWRKRWSDTELKPWEEETEVGTFEVLSVCNVFTKIYLSLVRYGFHCFIIYNIYIYVCISFYYNICKLGRFNITAIAC